MNPPREVEFILAPSSRRTIKFLLVTSAEKRLMHPHVIGFARNKSKTLPTAVGFRPHADRTLLLTQASNPTRIERNTDVFFGFHPQGEKVAAQASAPRLNTPNNKTSSPNTSDGLQLALAAARVAINNRGQDVAVLDLRDVTPICDFFVVASGTSRRQLHAISEEIDEKLERELGDRRYGREGYDESRWILLDYGNVVVHLFDEETRKFYDIEGLWGDAKRVDLTDILPGN